MKLVIVEDEIRIREGLVRLIGKLSEEYEVVGEADNGAQGLELVSRLRPDVVVTDIKMPEMDGLEMLTRIYEKKIPIKAVVLSAYSEFEYARQAMRMGVKEYLLKPIVVGEISEALMRVKQEIDQEKIQPEEAFGSLEQIFAGIVTGTLEAEEMEKKLNRYFGVSEETRYHEICLYLGSEYEKAKIDAKRELEQLIAERKEMKYVLLELDREKTLLILVYHDEKVFELERWVQYWIFQNRSRRGVLGFYADLSLEEIKRGLDTLLAHMDWNLSLGDGVMISYPKITRLQTNPCIYPQELEKQMKLAVCTGETGKIRAVFSQFQKYFGSEKVYAPREIKECCVRFFWAFLNTAKELGVLQGEAVEQQKLLERIMAARTTEELQEVEEFLLEKMRGEEEEAVHLTVKRAQSMIQEFYQTGITLEEIANRLNITPEYLGTKFHQELGVTFSAYMKNFRMKKAKELLIGTNLKLYQIAERVGYADSKYFSRVFKETTGQLPADYRKTQK